MTSKATALRLLLSSALLMALAGCEREDGQFVNADWHRKDLNAHLARWVAVAPTPSGLMLGQFNRNWQPQKRASGDLTIHSRVVYAMIVGYEATGDQRYADAARRGADFMLQYFRDPQYGGFYQHVDAAGKVVDNSKNTYSHAFAVLALSHMARVTGDERYKQAALTAWRDIRSKLRDADGGFVANASREFAPASGLRTQNPVMHMFEALLALVEATGDPGALEDARSVGNFVLYKLMVGLPGGGAYIPEWYDAQWKPLATADQGAYIDIGHQFEWSHLLRTAERRGLPPMFADVGDRLLKYAIANGYDEASGGIFNRIFPDGSVDRHKYWWQQAEAMRAFMAVGQRPEMARRYQQTLELVDHEMLDRDHGGWRLGAKRTCDDGLCGDLQPEPYHLVGLDVTALSMASTQ